jgi:XTP/dITP diphosphohydrolase
MAGAIKRVLLATGNPGKLRDFAGAASRFGLTVELLENFASIPPAIEDGATFEANARKKAEHYSRYTNDLIIADDSGLEVDALNGAPGVHSARFAALQTGQPGNSGDEDNNRLLLERLKDISTDRRTSRFICVIAAARAGKTLQTFRGTVEGCILDAPRGLDGFGYDPLFFVAEIGKTFAEILPTEKAGYSHRGRAFALFLEWLQQSG